MVSEFDMEGHTQFVLFLKCTIWPCYLICDFIHTNIKKRNNTIKKCIIRTV